MARGPGSILTRFGPELQSYLRQSASEAENGFVLYMLDQTQGFTHAGIERLNDSVTADPLAILGAFLTLPGTKSSTSDSGSERSQRDNSN